MNSDLFRFGRISFATSRPLRFALRLSLVISLIVCSTFARPCARAATTDISLDSMQSEAFALLPKIQSLNARNAPRALIRNGELVYPFALYRIDPSFQRAYKAFNANPYAAEVLRRNPFLGPQGTGPQEPIEVLQVGDRRYALADICQPHACSDNYMLLLYDPTAIVVVGLHVTTTLRSTLERYTDTTLLGRSSMTLQRAALLMIAYARKSLADEQMLDISDLRFPLSPKDSVALRQVLRETFK